MENQLKLDDYRFQEVNVRLCLKEASVYYSDTPITDSDTATDVIKDILLELDREVVCVVNLDSKSRPMNYNMIAMGSIDQCMFAIRDIFKSSILSNAASVILFHNHPSGDPKPSIPDITMTQKVIEAGKLLGIPVNDHIIIGGITGKAFSFRKEGVIFNDVYETENVAENKSFYKEGGTTMDTMMETAAKEAEALFSNYETVKKNLFIKVRNIKTFDPADFPHKIIDGDGELAITYHLKLPGTLSDSSNMAFASAWLKNDNFKKLEANGISLEQLKRDAIENSAKIFPCRIDKLSDFVGQEMQGGQPEMLVCRSIDPGAGAATLFYPGVFEELAQKCEGSFCCIPSSIHEFLIMPDSYQKSFSDPKQFLENSEEMIREVNANEVLPKDWLSDKLFHYDSEKKIFETFSSYYERTKTETKTMTEKNPEAR